MLDGHDRFGVRRGGRGRRFGDGCGRRVQLLLVVQVVLVGRGRLEHNGRAAAGAESARVVRGGRGVLVERPVQLLVPRVTGWQRRYGHGRWPPVQRRAGGRRRVSLRRPPVGRRRRGGRRRVDRGRGGRGRVVGRVFAGHVGQRPYARFRGAALRRQQSAATAASSAAGGRRRHGREPVVRLWRGHRMVVVMVVAEVRWRWMVWHPRVVAVVVRWRVVQEVSRRRPFEQFRRVRSAVGPRLAPLAARVVGARPIAVLARSRTRVFTICRHTIRTARLLTCTKYIITM